VLGHERRASFRGRKVSRVKPGQRVVLLRGSCEPRAVCRCALLVREGPPNARTSTRAILRRACISGTARRAGRVRREWPSARRCSRCRRALRAGSPRGSFCSFHAVLKDPPDGDAPTVLIYGAGAIGPRRWQP
jgi:hypothetical protein